MLKWICMNKDGKTRCWAVCCEHGDKAAEWICWPGDELLEVCCAQSDRSACHITAVPTLRSCRRPADACLPSLWHATTSARATNCCFPAIRGIWLWFFLSSFCFVQRRNSFPGFVPV
jgi:hypothetical protein